MDMRGGTSPNWQIGQVGGQQAAAAVPSLLQMAQGEAPAMGERGGAPQFQQAAWDNPANWGPAPAPSGPMPGVQQGWFPDAFSHGSNPQGKFWSMGDYMRQYQQKYGGQLPEVLDERHVNTNNPAMLANAGRPFEPGAFMYAGHHISPGKMNEDLHQGWDPSGEGGVNRPPIRRTPRFGPEAPAAFPYGALAMVGLPGQLEPWATVY